MDPGTDLRKLREQIQQQYRNMHAATNGIGANNPFNNQYLQQLTQGQLTSSGLTPGGATGGNYGNDISGVLSGLMDRMRQQSQPAVNGLTNMWNKLSSSFK